MSKKNALLNAMDEAAIALLDSVNGSTVPGGTSGEGTQPIDLKGRVAAFEAVTAFLAVKHKIQPEGSSRNGIDRYRRQLSGNGGTPGRGTGSEDSDGDADAEDD